MSTIQDINSISLPAHGPEARGFVLHRAFGNDLSQVWVANVEGPHESQGWKGGRVGGVLFEDDDKHAHYFNSTTIAGTARTNAHARDGVVFLLDDVGEKLDRDLFDLLAPIPTLLVETSKGCWQAQYVLEPSVTARELSEFRQALKGGPWHEGVKDASGWVQYMRLPSGVNVKPDKYGFKTTLVGLGPKYTLRQLMQGFGVTALKPNPLRPVAPAGVAGARGNGHWRASVAEVKALLGIIGNGPEWDDRDDYVTMGHMIIAALGKTDEARELWLWWCSLHPQRAGEPEFRWEGFPEIPTTTPEIAHGALGNWARIANPQATAGVVFSVVDEGPVSNGHDPTAPAKPEKIEPLGQALDKIHSGPGLNRLGVGASQRMKLRRTIIPGFERGEVTLVYGHSDAFKSLYVLQLMTALVIEDGKTVGQASIDWTADGLIVSNEDDVDVLRGRCAAINRQFKLTKTIHDLDLIDDVKPFRKVASVGGGRQDRIEMNPRFVERFNERAKYRHQAVVNIDTMTGAIEGGSDESNQEYAMLIGAAREFAKKTNICVIIVHHPRKGQGGVVEDEDSFDDIRGGSSLGNAARNIVKIMRPSGRAGVGGRAATGDRGEYGFSDDDMTSLIKVRVVKRSYGPRGPLEWFRIQVWNVDAEDDRRPGVLAQGGTAPVLEPIAAPVSVVQNLGKTAIILDAIAKSEAAGAPLWDNRRDPLNHPNTIERATGMSGAGLRSILKQQEKAGRIETYIPDPNTKRRHWRTVKGAPPLEDSPF